MAGEIDMDNGKQ